MGTAPVESLVADSLSTGHMEFQPIPGVIATIPDLAQPALLVALGYRPKVVRAIKNYGLRATGATTLRFAMNLMSDGWCQIVWLSAQLPGLMPDNVAIVHHVGARETAVLASVLPGGGIMFTQKPRSPGEFVALMQSVAESRPIPCGRAENFAIHLNGDC
jgi:hypothetical protein